MRSCIPCEYLEKRGYEITYLDVDENGMVKVDELEESDPPGYDPDFCDVCKQ